MAVYLRVARKQSTIKRNKTGKKNRNVKFSMIFYVLAGMVVILGLFYGIIANKVVTTGYDIKVTEGEINDLKNKNDELRIAISESKSIQVLESKIIEIGMMEPGEVEYMSINREVALRN